MEQMLVSAASHFREQGLNSFILGQGIVHPFVNELSAAGYNVRTISAIGRSWTETMRLRKFVREMGIDIIHIHTEGNYFRTVLACRIALGVRGNGQIIRTIHSVFDATGAWRFKRWTQALLADRFVKAIISPSPDVAANEKKLGRRTKVVFNWVDDRFTAIRAERAAYRGTHASPKVVLIVGNCSEIKHHKLALHAVLNSDFSVIHLGNEDGAADDELELLERLAQDGRLIGRGVGRPDDALRKVDVFAMPSRHEGMGVALAEALVVGVPSLVTDVPGLRWAKNIEGVSALSELQADWDARFRSWTPTADDYSSLLIDLSAARGAREYTEIYRDVLQRAGKWRLSI